MKITDGKWIHDTTSWSDKKLKSYLDQGWVHLDSESKSPSKKKDISMTVEATVVEPTDLKENNDG